MTEGIGRPSSDHGIRYDLLLEKAGNRSPRGGATAPIAGGARFVCNSVVTHEEFAAFGAVRPEPAVKGGERRGGHGQVVRKRSTRSRIGNECPPAGLSGSPAGGKP